MAVPFWLYQKSMDRNMGERRSALLWALHNLHPQDLHAFWQWMDHRYPALHRDEQAMVEAMKLRLQREAGASQREREMLAAQAGLRPQDLSGLGFFNLFDMTGQSAPSSSSSSTTTVSDSGTNSSSSGSALDKAKEEMAKKAMDPNFWLATFRQGTAAIKDAMCLANPTAPGCPGAKTPAPTPQSPEEMCNLLHSSGQMSPMMKSFCGTMFQQKFGTTAPTTAQTSTELNYLRAQLADMKKQQQSEKKDNTGLFLLGAAAIMMIAMMGNQ